MGRVIVTTQDQEDIVYADLNTIEVDETRERIPVGKQQRFDLYNNVVKE